MYRPWPRAHTRVPGVIGLYNICQEWLRWCCASSAWLTNSVITGTSAPRTSSVSAAGSTYPARGESAIK